MCTAITFKGEGKYFGRNLDLEYRYDERVTITPRNYILRYKSGEIERRHFAMIGMATVIDRYPLYYDAINEYGLGIASLNFEGNAHYNKDECNDKNLAPYELTLFLLGRCKTVKEAIDDIDKINLVDIQFNSNFPNTPLHWILADKKECVVIEYMKDDKRIYSNPIGVLTNNPPFDFHLMNLNHFINLTRNEPACSFAVDVELTRISRGLGALGLPGDNSSASRFIRAAFAKLNSIVTNTKLDDIGQVFHILRSVEQVEGTVKTAHGFEKTQYSSCCDLDEGVYYYTTYNNFQINAVGLRNVDLEGDQITSYNLNDSQEIKYIN